MSEFICLDIETTGLNVERDSIIEFAAVRFNESEILDSYKTFVYYPNEIPPIVEHLTGINQEMLENAPKIEEVKDKILEFCGDLPIMGHNINFDLTFLHDDNVMVPGFQLDTLPLSHILFKSSPSFSLETLCRTHNKQYQPSHRAMDDVLANVELFWTLLENIKKFSPEQSYLWDLILQNNNSPLAKQLLEFLPQEKSEPTFKDIKKELQTPNTENIDTEVIVKEDASIKEIELKNEEQLIAVSTNTIRKLDEEKYTKLPEYLSLISPNYFLEACNQSNISDTESTLLLKVATKIPHKFPLYKQDLNLFGNDYQLLNKLLLDSYHIPQSNKPYLTSHYTFFKLIHNNELPTVKEVHFEKAPFLEETYIKAKQQSINLHFAENGKPSNELTFAFTNLAKYLNKVRAQMKYPSQAIILDTFDIISEELTNFIHTVQENSNNPHVTRACEEIRSNNNLLVWANYREGYSPSVLFIEKGTHLELEQTLKDLNAERTYIYSQNYKDHPFFIKINEDIPEPNSTGHLTTIKNEILNYFKNLQTQGIIISTSKAQITELHKALAKEFDEQGISLLTQYISGSKGKILDNIENNESPLILLCTQHFLLRNKPKLVNLEKAVLSKIPMSLPMHPYYTWLKSQTNNDFMELTIPYTANTIYEICTELETDSLKLLDKRLITANWGLKLADHLPKNIVLQTE